MTNGRAWAPPGSTWKIGVDLDEAAAERGAEAGHDGVADLEDPAGGGVDGEVGVALPVADVGVGQAVPLVRERSDRLGEQLDARSLDGDLARRVVISVPRRRSSRPGRAS